MTKGEAMVILFRVVFFVIMIGLAVVSVMLTGCAAPILNCALHDRNCN